MRKLPLEKKVLQDEIIYASFCIPILILILKIYKYQNLSRRVSRLSFEIVLQYAAQFANICFVCLMCIFTRGQRIAGNRYAKISTLPPKSIDLVTILFPAIHGERLDKVRQQSIVVVWKVILQDTGASVENPSCEGLGSKVQQLLTVVIFWKMQDSSLEYNSAQALVVMVAIDAKVAITV